VQKNRPGQAFSMVASQASNLPGPPRMGCMVFLPKLNSPGPEGICLPTQLESKGRPYCCLKGQYQRQVSLSTHVFQVPGVHGLHSILRT
jgi:hypothetical protein